MNHIVIKGRLTKDPELKTTGTGKEMAKFSVAVNRRFDKDGVDFFDCTAWGKTGVFVVTYFKKGQEILLNGSIQCSKFQGDDGRNRDHWEINVDAVEFCGSKNEIQQNNPSPTPPPTYTTQSNSDFDEIIADDDLPF